MDPAEFRQGQRDQWDTAATGWRKWSELIDSGASAISERLVELAEVKPGSRVIDVAAGYGEPTLSAAKVAGPDGKGRGDRHLRGDARLRARARRGGRTREHRVRRVADASGSDFPEDSFDAALSRLGDHLRTRWRGAAAARVRGFLKPGARMAISSWGPPDREPFLGIPHAHRYAGARPPPPGLPVRSPDRPGGARRLSRAAGSRSEGGGGRSRAVRVPEASRPSSRRSPRRSRR